MSSVAASTFRRRPRRRVPVAPVWEPRSERTWRSGQAHGRYAAGTGLAAASPAIFGALIAKSAQSVFMGDLLASALMIMGAGAALLWGVDAERKSLEAIAQPLSVVEGVGRLAPKVAKADAASA